MITKVKQFYRNEVVIPCPLQCSDIVENNLVDDVSTSSYTSASDKKG